jgi:hypothetical protein
VEVSDNKTKHRQNLLEQGKVGPRLMTSQSLQIFNVIITVITVFELFQKTNFPSYFYDI